MAVAIEQATVGVKEAAQLLRCTVKRVRSAIRRGEVRAEKRAGRWGAEWRIERATLPEALTSSAGMGQTRGGGAGIDQALEVLRADLTKAREEYGRAMVEVGRLSAAEHQVKELEAGARSLVEAEATERVRAEGLARGIAALEGRLRLRTWTAAIAGAGFLVAVATVLLRL